MWCKDNKKIRTLAMTPLQNTFCRLTLSDDVYPLTFSLYFFKNDHIIHVAWQVSLVTQQYTMAIPCESQWDRTHSL